MFIRNHLIWADRFLRNKSNPHILGAKIQRIRESLSDQLGERERYIQPSNRTPNSMARTMQWYGAQQVAW